LAYTFSDEKHNIGSVVINPPLFVDGLQRHFRQYIALLRDPSQDHARSSVALLTGGNKKRRGPLFDIDLVDAQFLRVYRRNATQEQKNSD
jgi:hypothetical protein